MHTKRLKKEQNYRFGSFKINFDQLATSKIVKHSVTIFRPMNF